MSSNSNTQKLSSLIQELQAIQKKHGDIDVKYQLENDVDNIQYPPEQDNMTLFLRTDMISLDPVYHMSKFINKTTYESKTEFKEVIMYLSLMDFASTHAYIPTKYEYYAKLYRLYNFASSKKFEFSDDFSAQHRHNPKVYEMEFTLKQEIPSFYKTDLEVYEKFIQLLYKKLEPRNYSIEYQGITCSKNLKVIKDNRAILNIPYKTAVCHSGTKFIAENPKDLEHILILYALYFGIPGLIDQSAENGDVTYSETGSRYKLKFE